MPINYSRTRFWQTPEVRHLAWLCEAPSLVQAPNVFHLSGELPGNLPEKLLELDRNPAPLLHLFGKTSPVRLGQYFETLYGFLLTHILGWEVLLRNAPIRDKARRTLGELDFIVRNPATGRLQHHEVAVKFYLGVGGDAETLWYGPNAHDRLDLKTRRILDHQATMTDRPETRRLLAEFGFAGEIDAFILMPGYLFYPDTPAPSPDIPCWVNPDHQKGRWIRWRELCQVDTSSWTHLQKPHWLGPYQSAGPPDTQATCSALEEVRGSGTPRLFARMAPWKDGAGFGEIQRYFVVPDSWPGWSEAPVRRFP
ncbi:DUF1853 family protein [Marinobacter sp.]|uniref:DUF1853 family protein n=1 Tax=Marinobacter sp. TaxID=50741 RepID=UPI00384D5AD0